MVCLSSTFIYFGIDFWDAIPYLFVLFILDFQRPLVLKNYFIIYTALLFFVGGGFFFSKTNYIQRDGYLFLIFFVLGYGIYKLCIRNKPVKQNVYLDKIFVNKKILLLKRLIVVFLVIRLLLVFVDIMQHGVSNFFSGGGLVDKIDAYGKQDFGKGLIDIINNLITTIHVILTIQYVAYCLRLNQKISFLFISLTFLVLPLLTLSRSSFAFGAITVLLIYSISLRNLARITKRMAITSLFAIFSLLFVSVFIGGIRESRITSNSPESVDFIASISGELSPIIAYNNLHEKIDDLKYQLGMTIFPPLFFKVIPRSWYPDKPINSTAYYSMRYDKENFDSGFMLPSTIYGDLFLNFGTYISMVIILFFGIWISYLDNIYITTGVSKIHIFIIIHTGFYGLIRNNLPEGIFSIVQSLILYFIINAIVNTVLYKMNTKPSLT